MSFIAAHSQCRLSVFPCIPQACQQQHHHGTAICIRDINFDSVYAILCCTASCCRQCTLSETLSLLMHKTQACHQPAHSRWGSRTTVSRYSQQAVLQMPGRRGHLHQQVHLVTVLRCLRLTPWKVILICAVCARDFTHVCMYVWCVLAWKLFEVWLS